VDVGLAIAFAGLTYLVWALVAGWCRELVQTFIRDMYHAGALGEELPQVTRNVKVFFVDAGFVIDLVGLAWLVVTLVLVLLSSRQKIGVSWAWVSAMLQCFTAALGAVLVGWAVYMPHSLPITIVPESEGMTVFQRVSEISLPILVAVAVAIWVTFLVWLLVERGRYNRRGPSLRDGQRSNVFKS
jgi:hypothetical protein